MVAREDERRDVWEGPEKRRGWIGVLTKGVC